MHGALDGSFLERVSCLSRKPESGKVKGGTVILTLIAIDSMISFLLCYYQYMISINLSSPDVKRLLGIP